jgi:hypothetical protein
MVAFIIIITLAIVSPAHAQNWFVQRHYTSASCAGTEEPYHEAAGNGGPGPCSVASPCSPSIGTTPADYLVTACTGSEPSISLPEASSIQAYAYEGTKCDPAQLQSVSAFLLDTCISLASASIRYTCDPNSGATQMLYRDTACATFDSNTTLATGTAGSCQEASFDDSSTRFTCRGRAGSIGAISSTLFLLLLLCLFF